MTAVFLFSVWIPFSDDSFLIQFFPKLLDTIFEHDYVVSETCTSLHLVNLDSHVLPLMHNYHPNSIDLQVNALVALLD